MQDESEFDGAYLPGTHAVQFTAPNPEMCPSGHLVQGMLPEASLYVPASHAVQLPAGPVYPESHGEMQLVTSALPRGEKVEFGQDEHSCGEALYVFTGHGSQSTTLLTTALYFPGSQAVHSGSHGG